MSPASNPHNSLYNLGIVLLETKDCPYDANLCAYLNSTRILFPVPWIETTTAGK